MFRAKDMRIFPTMAVMIPTRDDHEEVDPPPLLPPLPPDFCMLIRRSTQFAAGGVGDMWWKSGRKQVPTWLAGEISAEESTR